VSSATYDLGSVAVPTFSVAPGWYTTQKNVTIAMVTGSATIHYTTNGQEPTESDATIASGSSLLVDRSEGIKAKAFLSGTPTSQTARADYIITGAIATGGNQTLALKSNGTVWAWGGNDTGQIGNGSSGSSPVAVTQVPGITTAIAIDAGERHSL